MVDGGVVNNLPIDHVKRHKGDILIAVNVNAPVPVDKPVVPEHIEVAKLSSYQEKMKEFYSHLQAINPLADHEEKFGYFDVINKTISFMTHHTTQLSLEKHTPDILINVSHDCCGTLDFYKAEEMVEMGKHTAIRSIEAYRNEINSI